MFTLTVTHQLGEPSISQHPTAGDARAALQQWADDRMLYVIDLDDTNQCGQVLSPRRPMTPPITWTIVEATAKVPDPDTDHSVGIPLTLVDRSFTNNRYAVTVTEGPNWLELRNVFGDDDNPDTVVAVELDRDQIGELISRLQLALDRMTS